MTYSYTILSGYFSASTPIMSPEQALIPLCGSWTQLEKLINGLQVDSSQGVEYKILFIGRHCQGYHNAMVDKHVPADHGLSHMEHRLRMAEVCRQYPLFDPVLTVRGQEEAARMSAIIKAQLEQASWGVQDKGATATVIEGLRERLHVHLCDARGSISNLRAAYPQVRISAGTANVDPLWQPGMDCRYDEVDIKPPGELMTRQLRGRETQDEIYARAEEALAQIMEESRDCGYVSITSHSFLLSEAFKVLGSDSRELSTGQIIPVVLRAERGK